ncbi:Zn(2)-C6 fungal-specific transcription factor [Mucor lusitanicus]
MSQQRRKKAVEYHFVDMNDPDRYKKIKVARACDFCRKRKTKCDIGIPGSGTCSNCKKANNTCIFSPVSTTASPRKERPSLVLSQDSSSSSNSGRSSSSSFNSSSIEHKAHTVVYQPQNPFFSMDQRGRCSYEKQDNNGIYNTMSSPPMQQELPVYTKQMEQELFDIYFCYVHPFYPILDRYYMTQAMKYDSESIPTSLKLAVMAVSLHFSSQQQDAEFMAAAYYQHASMQLDHTPSLPSLQTLFLLYKYQELITPVGSSLSNIAAHYLNQMQSMISQLQRPEADNDRAVVWSTQDEFVCRANWIVFIIITFSSTADDRWRSMLDCCGQRSKLPSLTETEHYDNGELNTFCNFKHLIKIALLYSQSLSLISDDSSLFVNADHPEFVQLAQGLDAWKSSLPSRITLALNADPPVLYSAQNHSVANIEHDSSKSGSYASYICLVHDILDLIISIHRSSTLEAPPTSEDLDIFKKASQVCYRAHSFTVGDMQTPHYSRLAAIQGSRIVSFGLTLALQAQSYVHEKASDKSLKSAKQYYSSCSLSFQIFDDMLLSPQLYMAIQTLRAQLDAKEQLNLATDHQSYEHSPMSSGRNSGSSAQSTPGIQQHQGIDYGFTRPTTTSVASQQDMSNSFYSYSNAPEHHQSAASSDYHTRDQQQPWHDYHHTTNNHFNATSSNWSMSYSNHPINHEQGHSSYHHQDDYASHRSVPITPTFEKEFGMSSPASNDPLTTPPLVCDTDSYFALQQPQQAHPHHHRQLQHLHQIQQQYSSFDAAIAIVSGGGFGVASFPCTTFTTHKK